MIKIKKGCVANISEDFKYFEYDCKCSKCDYTIIALELTKKLQALRDLTSYPIVITSGFRCPGHQEDLRNQGSYETAKGISAHEMGLAVDIICGAYSGEQLAELAEKVGFPNIGVSKRFVHLDIREGGPRRWAYFKR